VAGTGVRACAARAFLPANNLIYKLGGRNVRSTERMNLTIEKLVYGGDGLARVPGADGRSRAVFVPFVLPGERVEAKLTDEKPGFARASVTQLIDAAPERTAARCPYFASCGGCHYQHIPYERQLEFKVQILRETLERIAKIQLKHEIQLHPSPPWNYRNRTRLQVRTSPEFILAYYRFASNEVIPIRECPISSPLMNRVIAKLLQSRGCECPDTVEEIELFADSADEKLLAWCFCRRDADAEILVSWAERVGKELPEIAGITFFSSRREDDSAADPVQFAECAAQHIDYQVCGSSYRVSAGAFFQVNRYLVDELVSVVTTNVSGELALDLYAGVGLFSVALAASFHHIFAVEASQTSYVDLRHNAPANVKAVRMRTENYLSYEPTSQRADNRSLLRGGTTSRFGGRPSGGLGWGRTNPDLIILDPPRSGVGKRMIGSLVKLGAPRMRYISCDPATLARDLAPLLAAGYHVEETHLFDFFPETFHIESVIMLAR
jgi:23S rRNA (uracil1939-C5)-methyltransferase